MPLRTRRKRKAMTTPNSATAISNGTTWIAPV